MAIDCDQAGRLSTGKTDAAYFNSDQITATAVYSLLNAVDSESITDEFDIGTHSKTHDFDNHVKVAVREGIDPSGSLAELEETTDTAAEMEKMAASTFSRYTNDRDYRAVVDYMFELFHTPQLAHQRAVERKRLQRLTRGVVATDATTLELTRSVVVSDEFVGDDEYGPENRGDELPEDSGSTKTDSSGCNPSDGLQEAKKRLDAEEQQLKEKQTEKIREREQEEAEMGRKKRGRKPTPPGGGASGRQEG